MVASCAPGHARFDRDAGPVVRPYAFTSGRTRPAAGHFDPISIVLAVSADAGTDRLVPPETASILRMCRTPMSVAEIAAVLHLPPGTVKVMLSDLLAAQLIVTRAPRTTRFPKNLFSRRLSMDSVHSDAVGVPAAAAAEPVAAASPTAEPASLPTAVKILIAGHFGVGKTTMVGSVSEIQPLRTEELLTNAGVGVDDLSGVDDKTTTTVAMDFGRITIRPNLVLYLFGTPGQDRFSFVWDELSVGAIGAVVLADTRRLDDCFSCIDYFEERATPFIVAVNCFENTTRYSSSDVHSALGLDADVPVLLCDARRRESSKEVLIALLEHVIGRQRQRAGAIGG